MEGWREKGEGSVGGKSNEREKEREKWRVEKGWEKSAFAFQINVDDGR